MPQFTMLTSKAVPLPMNDIDTDQIIPARFMKGTDKEGLGDHLFEDWRYLPDGSPDPDFILNQVNAQEAQILIAGDNFGCGSSREHAPWALTDWGLRAVISTSFADIFRNNALKNGLLPVIVDDEILADIFDMVEEVPSTEFSIDLQEQVLTLPDMRVVHFPIDGFSKRCLLAGEDPLTYLLSLEGHIASYEETHDGS
jgi:3-isopropylmalate/(R)-2-methylmalate dehydratase small subunit